MDQPRMLVLRVGWMEEYKGEQVYWPGWSDEETRDWCELYNFQPVNGRLYGGTFLGEKTKQVHIEKFDRSLLHAESVDDVLVVWVAPKRGGRTVVVGWYDHATVYRRFQRLPKLHKRPPYFVVTKAKDAVLLKHNERYVEVPTGKGGMGEKNNWFSREAGSFRRKVLDFMERHRNDRPKPPPKGGPGHRRHPNPFRRQQVEKAAVVRVLRYYDDLGYDVKSVEKDNLGWDIEAWRGDDKLLIEVKGLSGKEIETDLTPREYAMCQEHADTYQICVVTSSLSHPTLRVFHYASRERRWVDDDGHPLRFREVTGARISDLE